MQAASTPIPPLGPSPCRPLGTTVGVLPRKKNFPAHRPWDSEVGVPGHRNVKWVYVTIRNVPELAGLTSHGPGVDGEASPPILLVLNLTQLKSHGIRLW